MAADLHWLVTGAGGMLGRDMVAVLQSVGASHTAATRADLDITNPDQVSDAVPCGGVVVNCAAWTDVDAAETDEATATAVNTTAVANLAQVCAGHGATLLHISTDAVFGITTGPHAEDAFTGPVNAYGRTKAAGEQAVLATMPERGYVVRTAWLYGRHGNNFPHIILNRVRQGHTVDVVDDQYGQPTWSWAVAVRLLHLGLRATARIAPPGIYHATATGQAAWYQIARRICTLDFQNPYLVVPVPAAEIQRGAQRPENTVLTHDRWALAGLPPMDRWEDMLSDAYRTNTFGTFDET